VARDGSVPMSRYADLGRLVQQNAALLLRHTRAQFAATTNDHRVLAVPRSDPATGELYVYLVNLDAEQGVRGSVAVSPAPDELLAVDVYSGRSDRGVLRGDGADFAFSLAPGQGRFLRLGSAVR
jgi:hypothetical protein